MIVTFIIDQMRLIIVLQNFGICGVDNVTSIKSKDAMILETVGGCREGSGEFREKILKGRQRDLRPALVTISSRCGRTNGDLHVTNRNANRRGMVWFQRIVRIARNNMESLSGEDGIRIGESKYIVLL